MHEDFFKILLGTVIWSYFRAGNIFKANKKKNFGLNTHKILFNIRNILKSCRQYISGNVNLYKDNSFIDIKKAIWSEFYTRHIFKVKCRTINLVILEIYFINLQTINFKTSINIIPRFLLEQQVWSILVNSNFQLFL